MPYISKKNKKTRRNLLKKNRKSQKNYKLKGGNLTLRFYPALESLLNMKSLKSLYSIRNFLKDNIKYILLN